MVVNTADDYYGLVWFGGGCPNLRRRLLYFFFQFGLHITTFSPKFRPVQLCCSRRRAAAANHVSWRSDTKVNYTAQPHTRRSDTNQPNTANYATQHRAVGPVMLMT